MDTWTLKKGYPVVHVEKLANQLTLSQKWFLLNPLSKMIKTEAFKTYKWFVPFTFTTQNSPKFEFESKPVWLIPSQNECKIKKIKI